MTDVWPNNRRGSKRACSGQPNVFCRSDWYAGQGKQLLHCFSSEFFLYLHSFLIKYFEGQGFHNFRLLDCLLIDFWLKNNFVNRLHYPCYLYTHESFHENLNLSIVCPLIQNCQLAWQGQSTWHWIHQVANLLWSLRSLAWVCTYYWLIPPLSPVFALPNSRLLLCIITC